MGEVALHVGQATTPARHAPHPQREWLIDNLLAQTHFIIVMIWWTGLAPWELQGLLKI